MGTITEATVLSTAAVEELPVEPLGDLPGIGNRVLWRDDRSIAGLLTVAAGHHLGAHTHRQNHHHMWVLTGRAVVLGQLLDAGSYVHIPCGVEHDIDATGTDGCTVYYLYLAP
jgi:mannose-6-phosphate isomerase-like protein (cupin superfamily)